MHQSLELVRIPSVTKPSRVAQLEAWFNDPNHTMEEVSEAISDVLNYAALHGGCPLNYETSLKESDHAMVN